MKIIVVAGEEDRWNECKMKLGKRHHQAVHVRKAAEVNGAPDLIFYLGDEDAIKQEMAGLKSYECPIFWNAPIGRIIENDRISVRLNCWPGFLLHETIEVAAKEEHKSSASRILDELGWRYKWVPDVVGLLTPRIIASIINEAYYTLGEGVSSKAEIDIAMRLGTNYPKGPFEWCEQIGIKNIFCLLTRLSQTNKRYTPAPQLIYESGNAWH